MYSGTNKDCTDKQEEIEKDHSATDESDEEKLDKDKSDGKKLDEDNGEKEKPKRKRKRKPIKVCILCINVLTNIHYVFLWTYRLMIVMIKKRRNRYVRTYVFKSRK